MIKEIIPYRIKINLHLIKNWIIDLFYGYLFRYAKNRNLKIDFANSLEIIQDVKSNDTSIAKKYNILIAIKHIELIQINPNEIFSFWNVIGEPLKERGFVESRSLINGELKPSIGGGLCQVSGLIYYISLYAGLEIIERHNHSVDIYTKESRFTPLGSDATIAYGYKDLRIKNNFDSIIKFTFILTDNALLIKLNSTETIKKNVVKFKKNIINQNKIEVITLVNNKIQDKSTYKK